MSRPAKVAVVTKEGSTFYEGSDVGGHAAITLARPLGRAGNQRMRFAAWARVTFFSARSFRAQAVRAGSLTFRIPQTVS